MNVLLQTIPTNVFHNSCIVALGLTAITYSWAMFDVFEFSKGNLGRRLGLVFGLLLNALILLLAMFNASDPFIGNAVACFVCLIASHILFWWAVRIHGQLKPNAAYADQAPERILQSGPYAMVRHPFYLAYLLAFSAGAAATGRLWTWLCPVSLLVIYFFTARFEEQQILNSELGSEYIEYRRRTGLFFPKISRLQKLN